MSWSDDNLPHLDGEFIIANRVGFILNKLDTHIHENVHGEEIDVRTIDKRYAENLINWYKRRFDVLYRPPYLIDQEERTETFENTVMIKTLRGVIEND